MVKNKQGGNRHKKMARKNVKPQGFKPKMRFAIEGETYARVIKMNGQGNVDVMCNDKILRLCVIRRKFRGRNKRDNTVKLDSILLVGLRDWEHRAEGKKPKVDLLYVYSESQIPELKKDSKFNTEILPNSVKLEDDSGIIFTNNVDDDEDFIQQEQKMKSSKNENKIMDIDFDDI
jgi:translation initiation factor IF-1